MQKNITKTERTNFLIYNILSQNNVVFVHFLNADSLYKFKTLISKKIIVDIFYINNNLKKSIHVQKKQLQQNNIFLFTNKSILQGGLYAIVCPTMAAMEYVLNLFSLTPLYKDKYFSFLKKKTTPLNLTLMYNFGFITFVKIQTFFFNFNFPFLDFFFNLKNEYSVFSQTLFSRQIVTATIWLYKSFIMISLKIYLLLILCFFFLIRQLIFSLIYANKQSITS